MNKAKLEQLRDLVNDMITSLSIEEKPKEITEFVSIGDLYVR